MCVHWSFDKIGGVIHILGVTHIFKYQSTLHSNIDMKKGSQTHPTPLGIVRRRPPQFCSILCHIKWLLCNRTFEFSTNILLLNLTCF